MFQKSTWRLVQTPPASGPWNMAVDEAILEGVGRKESPPTLRLFAWEPPCLSLGYAQPLSDVDQDTLTKRGWDIVRRPTGGRAILHTDELTYAVIAPPDEPRVAGSILESYQRLAQALLNALHFMEVQAHSEEKYGIPANPDPSEPICFEVPSNWEITLGGKKLIGSAQLRRRNGVLQHGSLPLHGDLARITQVLSYPDESSRTRAGHRLLKRAITVESALQKRISLTEAKNAFVEGFEKALNLKFITSDLTPLELSLVSELLENKYANSSWTARA